MTDTPQLLLAHHLEGAQAADVLALVHEKLARQCAAEGLDHVRFLLRLVELELIDRERRMVERRIKEARFPAVKSLDSFDFAAIPSLNKTLVLELARSEYATRRENVIAVGNSRNRQDAHRSPDWSRGPSERAIGRVLYGRGRLSMNCWRLAMRSGCFGSARQVADTRS